MNKKYRNLLERAKDVITNRSDTCTARNGVKIGIEGDNGEKCWIVSHDHMFQLQLAIEECENK